MGLGMSGLSRAGRRRARLQTAFAVLASLWAGVAAAAPPGFAGQPFAASRAYFEAESGETTSGRLGTQAEPAWFICDSLDSDRIYIVGLPGPWNPREDGWIHERGSPDRIKAAAAAKLPMIHDGLVVHKHRQPFVPAHHPAHLGWPLFVDGFGGQVVGPADPGAGQIYWPLIDDWGDDLGYIRAFNPGALTNPRDAFTPTITSMKYVDPPDSCRWLARTRMMGVSARRTVFVTQGVDGGFEYRTYDFKDAGTAKRIDLADAQQTTTPSLDIKGGSQSAGRFEFTHGGFTYDVTASPSGAAITVRRGSRPVQNEPLIAWTIAPAP
jgi:hypothetical protein